MGRLLRYARVENTPLARNTAHGLAASYALQHFDSGAIYSFIPKNGCTTMRYSLAVANGCIGGQKGFGWVHQNNRTFNPTLKELVCAPYSFAILRDPFTRLSSAFLDKFVAKDRVAWTYRRNHGDVFDLDDLTFRDFVERMAAGPPRRADEHWRMQKHFLVYDSYDDWFRLEDFAAATAWITEKTGLRIMDARGLAGHGTDRYTHVRGSFADTTVAEIATMKRNGDCPAHAALYDDALARLVGRYYGEDIALYTEVFGSDGLLFS